jgi:predicted PurR-regulated permease PerM
MEKNLSKIVDFTTKNFKNLRKTLRDLKKEREEQIKFKPQVSKKAEKDDAEEIIFHFSLLNVAKATIVVIAMVVLSQFLGEISHILLIFFISILFASALNPTVNALEKRYRVPRALSVSFIYLLLLLAIVFFISQLIPLMATQLVELGKSLTTTLGKLNEGPISLPFGKSLEGPLNDFLQQVDQEAVIAELKLGLERAASQLEFFAGNTLEVIHTVFNGVLNFIVVLVLTFFLVVNDSDVNEFFISLFPSKHGAYIAEKIHAIQTKVGYWLNGQITLMFLMFLLTWIGLLILGVDNALTLAMMTGIGELLPVVGPVASGIPAVLVAFNESPWLAVWVIGLIVLIQQIEGHVLIPLVMRKAVGLSPIIIILAMLTGLETLGIVGMIMAVPVATTVSIFVKEYAEKEK